MKILNKILKKAFSSKLKSKPLNNTNTNTNTTTLNNIANKNKSQFILLFTHETPKKYYLLNALGLAGYIAYSSLFIMNSDLPWYLTYTMSSFMALATAGLLAIFLISKRHVKSISLERSTRTLRFEIFSAMALKSTIKDIEVKSISHISPLSRYIPMRRTGIYLISFKDKEFSLLNKLFMRPVNFQNKQEFENIFKPLIKKN